MKGDEGLNGSESSEVRGLSVAKGSVGDCGTEDPWLRNANLALPVDSKLLRSDPICTQIPGEDFDMSSSALKTITFRV